MSTDLTVQLEIEQIQSGALHERPTPYFGTYLFFRIDSPDAGKEMLRLLLPVVDFGHIASSPGRNAWITVGVTYQGLVALGVPEESLASFSTEFQMGMAARAELLGDVGENAPDQWEKPLGDPGIHVALSALSPNREQLESILDRARDVYSRIPGIEMIWRQDCYQLDNGRNPFGFSDGMGQPAIEGSGVPGTNTKEEPLKAGEFILGYPDETGSLPPMPVPDELGRNGTYVAFVKYHTRVAAFRQYVRDRASSKADEKLLAAKIVGRWQSGAPLVISPEQDDPELGADKLRNNDFQYFDADPRGLRCPAGSHARRMNPRDAFRDETNLDVRLHRVLRRGTSYGPPLPEGQLTDDGADRGIAFVFVGAHLKRQFEFVKTQWANDGIFIGASQEKDPLIGPNDENGTFTIPQVPIRRRLQGLPSFTVNRGGEYFFIPGKRALQWLAELES